MHNSFLEDIIQHKKLEVEGRKKKLPLKELILKVSEKGSSGTSREFEEAISRQGQSLKLIAEIKRASPSKGILRENYEPSDIARIYEASGAHAISVLTDQRFFQGDLNDLRTVSKVTTLPVLCKDFILDIYQVYEAKLCGAKAILLIVAALEEDELHFLIHESEKLGLSSLVEVHDEKDLEIALRSKARILGINNRDLRSFHVDLKVCEKLSREIPSRFKIVVESGMMTRQDVIRVSELPVDAILVGEVFMRASDISGKIRELMGI